MSCGLTHNLVAGNRPTCQRIRKMAADYGRPVPDERKSQPLVLSLVHEVHCLAGLRIPKLQLEFGVCILVLLTGYLVL